MIPVAELDLWSAYLPAPLALAVVAVLGYLIGQKTRRPTVSVELDESRKEMRRAKAVARELEHVAETIRKNLVRHHASVTEFKARVCRMGDGDAQISWQELCHEAELVLAPTLELATSLSTAYERIRQQSSQLLSFTEVRTDPLTGVSNRRALDESLADLFATLHRYGHTLSIAHYDIDHFKQINDRHGHLHGDEILRQVAKAIDDSARDTDLVSRYGGEEFVVVMPNTNLIGASIFSERLRQQIERSLPVTVSAGVAEAIDADTPQTLLARADSAMYGAKSDGRNRVYCHDGKQPIANLTRPAKA
jgi:diguanylate cyclase (GGDEF)-like protein